MPPGKGRRKTGKLPEKGQRKEGRLPEEGRRKAKMPLEEVQGETGV